MSMRSLIEEARKTQPHVTESKAYRKSNRAVLVKRSKKESSDMFHGLCEGSKTVDSVYIVCNDVGGGALSSFVENNRKIYSAAVLIGDLSIKPKMKNEILLLLQKALKESSSIFDCDDYSFLDEESDWGFFCSEVSLYYVDESNPYESVHGCWELYFTECYEVDGYGFGCVDSFIQEPTHLPLLPSYVFDKQSLKVLFG